MELSGGMPRARTADLVVQPAGDELLVYDLRTHRAHALNATSAQIWRACDGATAPAEVLARLAPPSSAPVDPSVLAVGLQRGHVADEPARRGRRQRVRGVHLELETHGVEPSGRANGVAPVRAAGRQQRPTPPARQRPLCPACQAPTPAGARSAPSAARR